MFVTLALLFDMISVSTTALTIWFILLPDQANPIQYLLLVFMTSILFPLLLSLLDGYRSFSAVFDFEWFTRVTVVWLSVALMIILGLWAVKLSEDFSRLWLGSWFVIAWLAVLFWRAVVYMLIMQLRAKGYNHKRVVIVGAGQLGKRLIQQLQMNTGTGFEVVALFDDDAIKWQTQFADISIFPAYELSNWLTRHGAHEVWFALPLRAELRLRELLHTLRHSTVNIRYVPNLTSLRLLNHAPREILGFSMLDLSVSPMSDIGGYWLKSLEDKLLASLILLLISPVMLFISLAIKLTSPGPIFYRQNRVGFNGKVFNMLKFRSMPVDIEKEGVSWGNAANKTNTRLGSFIRKTSLDELPQFINVLLGDMSIVGPRPERPQFVEQFKDDIPGYMQKHMVKAGITGWAQVHGFRGDTCLATRIEYDLWYIEHWSLGLDLRIIFLTLLRGFTNKNAC